jgi:hypothetical protein
MGLEKKFVFPAAPAVDVGAPDGNTTRAGVSNRKPGVDGGWGPNGNTPAAVTAPVKPLRGAFR